MPELPLHHWQEQPWLTCLEVQAVMLFPGNEARREQYVARGREYHEIDQKLKECLSDNERGTVQIWHEKSIGPEVIEAAKLGDIAGRILSIIYLDSEPVDETSLSWRPDGTHDPDLRRSPLGRGSVGRAKDAIFKARVTPGSPDPFWGRVNLNERRLDAAWRGYKSVSHLWAAVALTSSAQTILEYPDLASAFTIVSPKLLQGFLEFAQHLRRWVEARSLQGDELWNVPESFPTAEYDPMIGGWPLHDTTLNALATYRAKR